MCDTRIMQIMTFKDSRTYPCQLPPGYLPPVTTLNKQLNILPPANYRMITHIQINYPPVNITPSHLPPREELTPQSNVPPADNWNVGWGSVGRG